MPSCGEPELPGLGVGAALGPYRLESFLGEGGMGVVYRAARQPDGEIVALKVLRDELAADEIYVRRFLREGEVARSVRHRHVVPVLDAGEIEGRHYLASRYVRGRSLAQRIAAEGPLPVADVLEVAAHIGAALDELHRQELVHRDVKPSNIMLEENGDAALTDFGLARGAAHTVLTQPGRVVGTMDYLAPEVIRGELAGPASDLYAFGCVLFECAAGEPPFGGLGYVEACLAHLQQPPPDPAAGREDISDTLSWALLRALAKSPHERPGTGTAYARLMRSSAAGG